MPVANVHVPLGLLSGVVDWLLGLSGVAVLAIAFLLPALEASIFLGVVVPGETAVVIGGALASQGRVPLWSAIAAAILGAVIGDSVGYWVGRRLGPRLLERMTGRVLRRERIERGEQLLRKHRGAAVFLGRFSAGLRALIPGLAGTAGIHYPSFLLYNALGGVVWGGGFTLLGYLAGQNWHRVEKLGSGIGFAILGAFVLGWAAIHLLRRRRRQPA